eukprot:1669804-Rhodomonas_salina.3
MIGADSGLPHRGADSGLPHRGTDSDSPHRGADSGLPHWGTGRNEGFIETCYPWMEGGPQVQMYRRAGMWEIQGSSCWYRKAASLRVEEGLEVPQGGQPLGFLLRQMSSEEIIRATAGESRVAT